MISFLLTFLILIPTAWSREIYTMADLEVLAQDESHQEFFQHAMDVRPSERQEDWKSMVSKMADSFSRRILAKSAIDRNDFQKVEKLFDWPSLKSDDIFRVRRQEVSLRYLKTCLKGASPCWEDVKAFWEKDKTDPETAFRLAEMTSGLPNSPFSTWTFLEVALKSPLSEFYCKKEFAMSTLWGKIEIDYVKLGPEGDLMVQIDRTVHPDCLPSLILEARKRLYSPPQVTDRELAFQILKSQSKATEDITDFFYTVYLLDNPSKGELFNYSWNRVKELGGTVSRREAVLEKLKKLDPLPDHIFKTLDDTKKKVVLRHFKTYFPEYLDHYTDQCVNYYGGQGTFPSGNPTVHCQEFMNSELAPLIIDEFKIKKYEEVRKI
ncbi:MAG: hypothetical protein ACLGHN_06080 [Bacteriovoracia bacterium]